MCVCIYIRSYILTTKKKYIYIHPTIGPQFHINVHIYFGEIVYNVHMKSLRFC